MSGGKTGKPVRKASGKTVWELPRFEHQVIVITLKGPIDASACTAMNTAVKKMKEAAGAQGIFVTIDGLPTPNEWRGTRRKK